MFLCSPFAVSQTLPISESNYVSLKQSKCENLERVLKNELSTNPRLKRLIKQKHFALAVVDLNDPNHIKFAGINEYHMMYAASLPKIAILYTVMDAVENNEIPYTPELKKSLKKMIAVSSNKSATEMIDKVGFDRIEQTLRKEGQALYDEAEGGGLWVGKRYAAQGDRRGDPLKNLSHGATAFHTAYFYYQLVYGKLINSKRSAEMLEILRDPKLNHKFIHTLSQIAPKAKFFRKSGSWKQYHSDSVLIWGPDRKYIVVALVESPQGEQIIRNLIKPIENALKSAKNSTCNL